MSMVYSPSIGNRLPEMLQRREIQSAGFWHSPAIGVVGGSQQTIYDFCFHIDAGIQRSGPDS
jgi:hypothetical protein